MSERPLDDMTPEERDALAYDAALREFMAGIQGRLADHPWYDPTKGGDPSLLNDWGPPA
jgi:hypothetical protein